MQKHKALRGGFSRKGGFAALLLVAILGGGITGCDLFNQSLPDFFKEWTSTARVAAYYSSDGPTTADGFLNLPSAGDQTIHLLLDNPQNYNLDVGATFPSGIASSDGSGAAPQPGVDWTARQNSASSVSLTLTQKFLEKYDGTGSDVSPTIRLTEPRSGRTFEGCDILTRANSAPPQVENAKVLYTTSGNYVVVFNMPDTSGIHRDIKQLTVSGERFDKTYTVTPTGDSNNNGLAGYADVKSAYDSTWRQVAGGSEFTGNKNVRFAGIVTSVLMDTGNLNPSFTITLTDSSGLTSTATATASTQTLANVTATLPNGSEQTSGQTALLRLNNTGNPATVTFKHSDAAAMIHIHGLSQSDVSVTDGIFSSSGDEVTGTGGSISVTFTAAKTYSVTVWATRSGYVDSGHTTFNYNVKQYQIKATLDDAQKTQLTQKFVLGTGSQTVRFSLEDTGGTEATNVVSSWSSSSGSVSDGGETFTFSDDQFQTGTYRLDVTATLSSEVANGGTVTGTFTVGKISIPSSGGSQTVNDTIEINMPVTIAPQNGQTVTITTGDADKPAFRITDGGSLTLGGDASGQVVIDGGENSTATPSGSQSLIRVEGGTLTINDNVTIRDNRLASGNGGALYITSGVVTMTGGKIDGCKGQNFGGAVYIAGGEFRMSGGTIENCEATYTSNATWGGGGVTVMGGNFTMSESAIIRNNNARMGGGVYVGWLSTSHGTFTMNGGTIQGNTAQGSQRGFGGGGVYVYSGGTFILNNGTITGNTSAGGGWTPGGGIAVHNGDNGSTFRYVSANISGNTAAGRCPDVFVASGVRYATSASGEAQPLAADITDVAGLTNPQY